MHNSSYHHTSRRSAPHEHASRCIAFVDARFIDWLGDKEDAERHTARLDGLRPMLENLLEDANLAHDLLRIYWYSSDSEPVNGLLFRSVAPETADTGVSMVLSMSRDMMALASQGACDQVLVVSDDDRLLPVIDHMQSCGVRVCILADESAQDLSTLTKSDPAWASVLRQADVRLMVSSAELERCLWGEGAAEGSQRRSAAGREDQGLRQGRHRQSSSGPVDETAMRSHLGPMVASWWTHMESEAQAELARQLPEQRGLPQETDRSLLLHLSQQLGRPLTLHEKKAMREMARDVVNSSQMEISGPADIPV